ncbi:hypothetical protein [Candidatus Pelagibacter sp.]|uniref:hypothetical protein n=1 Tax=Candidatus Pelagibacter sp. TaxID=2024849 RepID=UPI003F85F09F
MTSKGFTGKTNNIETPHDINLTEKPLNSNKISSGRVDINVLKSKLEAEQSKELRKNIFIFSFCVLLLGSIGIFLSL